MSDIFLAEDADIGPEGQADRRGPRTADDNVMRRILIVEDDRDQARELRDYLCQAGYKVDHASDGRAFRAMWQSGEPDAIILDLNLPGESGTEVMQYVRKSSLVPILIVSGRSDPVDRVVGLELGADDYIMKPFHPRELLARVAAVLRRTHATGPDDDEVLIAADSLQFQGFRLEVSERALRGPDGSEVHLTSATFRLLEAFARRPGKTITRDQLTQLVYGRHWRTEDRSVDNLILRLRKTLQDHLAGFDPLKSVRGEGYVFAVKVDSFRDEQQA